MLDQVLHRPAEGGPCGNDGVGGIEFGDCLLRLSTHLPSPQEVDTAVVRNPKQPWADRPAVVVGVEPPVSVQTARPGRHLRHRGWNPSSGRVLLLRKEITASLHEADRAIALNPFDAGCNANMGANIAFAGDWVRDCALIGRSMDLNPQHPVWYRGMLSYREY